MYILGKSCFISIIWYASTTLFIALFFIFYFHFISDILNFEFSSYFGELVFRIFGAENFESILRSADIAQMDEMSLIFLFSCQVAGAVLLPILVLFVVPNKSVFSLFILSNIIALLIIFVGDFTNERNVNFAISSMIDFFSSKMFNSWLLVLSLIVFVRAWRKYQATA